MSRAGYGDGGSYWEMICWRGAVESAIRGKRGQEFLKEFRVALDTMAVKELHTWDLQDEGKMCSLGAIGAHRGIDMTGWDPEDHDKIGEALNIANALVREIEFMNDEYPYSSYIMDKEKRDKQEKTMAGRRWHLMRQWVNEQIPKEAA